MSDETTPRLKMPMIVPGQAQKEVSHNEALALLDLLVQGSVVALGRTDPPPTPGLGDAWIVGTAASGAWSGHDRTIADGPAGDGASLRPPRG